MAQSERNKNGEGMFDMFSVQKGCSRAERSHSMREQGPSLTYRVSLKGSGILLLPLLKLGESLLARVIGEPLLKVGMAI